MGFVELEAGDSLLGLGPWTIGALATSVGYGVLCAALRFRRRNQMRDRFGFPNRESLSRMTNNDAQKILEVMALYEFPLFYDLSMRYALFKTYAVDNIGKLLFQVSDLAKPTEASKRYDDTQVLFASYAKFPPGSEYLAKAIARTNYLHSPYIKSGKIRNEDLLYVLFESMYEPCRFLGLFEWRGLSEMEKAALATHWKYIGEMMEIDYKAELGHDQWKDGIEFMDDLEKWAYQYEIDHLKPSPEVARVGEVSVNLLLSAYPKFARDLGYKFLLVLMGERMRHAFSFPEPGLPETVLAYSLIYVRKLFIRYLCLPRFMPIKFLDNPDPQTGRIKQYHYLKDPWYTPVTFWGRWGPEALLRRVFGLRVPGDGPEDFKSDGFLFEDLGPRSKVGKGADETVRLAKIAHTKVNGSACPFALPKGA